MKRIIIILLTVLGVAAPGSLFAQLTQEEAMKPTSYSNTSATQLNTDSWYVLYNRGRKVYAYESANKITNTSVEPQYGLAGKALAPYLVKFVPSGTSYTLQTGLGNYYKALTNSAELTGPTGGKFSVNTNGGGHWFIKDSSYGLDSDGKNSLGWSANTTNDGNQDWALYEVNFYDLDYVYPDYRAIYNLSKGGLFRLQNVRNTGRYITENASGVVSAAAQTTGADKMYQYWIIEPVLGGVTLRNAGSGKFLQTNYTSGSSKQVWNAELSPNYMSMPSHDELIFWHGTARNGCCCINLNGANDNSLTDWYYSNDKGSEWKLVEVLESETPYSEVRDHITAQLGYSQPEVGSYYRFINLANGEALTENISTTSSLNNKLITLETSETAYSQMWKVEVANEEKGSFNIRNIYTNRCISRKGTSTNGQYNTTSNAASSEMGLGVGNYEWMTTTTIYEMSKTTNGLFATDGVVNNGAITDQNAQWLAYKLDITDADVQAAQDAYDEYLATKNTSTVNTNLKKFFADQACTKLKDEYQAMSDDELYEAMREVSIPTTFVRMAQKIKNDSWEVYTNPKTGYKAGFEKFFRIADYKVYSDPSLMNAKKYVGCSYEMGHLSNPTGIYANTGDVLYIFCNNAAPSGSSLAAELVSTEYPASEHRKGTQVTLKAGLNLITVTEPSSLYIYYQANNGAVLRKFPDQTIHIEGGRLAGYFDITRGMTNEDWAILKDQLLGCPVLNLKSENLVHLWTTDVVKGINETKMREVVEIWDHINGNERRYMGLDDIQDVFRNVWNTFSMGSSYMYASTNGTYYNDETLPTILSYSKLTTQNDGNEGGTLWGPSHEMGHSHQEPIRMAGTTESSNNMFSNINLWEQGVSTTRYRSPIKNFEHFNNCDPWNYRDITVGTRLYFQLYLYYEYLGHHKGFLGELFKKMRAVPMTPRALWDDSLTAKDGDETINGGYRVKGTQDYLLFAKNVCDVLGEDLTEFFEAYGFFEPIDNYHIGDYANYWMFTTQQMIDETREYLSQYPKKSGNIMFIDDHIKATPVEPSASFYTTGYSGNRVNCCTYEGSKFGTAGDLGLFTMFTGEKPEKYADYYNLNTSTGLVTFHSVGDAVGFKVYDESGKLVFLSNEKSFTLPATLRKAAITIVAAYGDLSDHKVFASEEEYVLGINTIEADTLDSNSSVYQSPVIYDLQGRRISTPRPGGIYVVNGKKVVK